MATPDYTNINTNLNTQRANQNTIRQSSYDLNPTDPESNGLLQTSTNIFVYANESLVGMIQTFTVTENRPFTKLQALGWEGVVQNVPGNTDGGTLNVSRLALYESSMWNALGMTNTGKAYNPIGSKVHDANGNKYSYDLNESNYKSDDTMAISKNSTQIFKTLKDQRTPFEIQVKTRRKGATGGSVSGTVDDYFIDTYIDCWLQSYTKTYGIGAITVTETAVITYADVY